MGESGEILGEGLMTFLCLPFVKGRQQARPQGSLGSGHSISGKDSGGSYTRKTLRNGALFFVFQSSVLGVWVHFQCRTF